MIIRKVDLFSKVTLNSGGGLSKRDQAGRYLSSWDFSDFKVGNWEAMTWRKPGRKMEEKHEKPGRPGTQVTRLY